MTVLVCVGDGVGVGVLIAEVSDGRGVVGVDGDDESIVANTYGVRVGVIVVNCVDIGTCYVGVGVIGCWCWCRMLHVLVLLLHVLVLWCAVMVLVTLLLLGVMLSCHCCAFDIDVDHVGCGVVICVVVVADVCGSVGAFGDVRVDDGVVVVASIVYVDIVIICVMWCCVEV